MRPPLIPRRLVEGHCVCSCTLVVIAILSAMLNTWNNTGPLGYHIDEPKKVRFIETDDQDFGHPLLMLQVVRGLCDVCGLSEVEDILRMGRLATALYGVLTVCVAYSLVGQTMQPSWGLFAALGIAVSPVLVIHAHYFKEDTLFAFCSLLCLRCFIGFVRRRAVTTAIALGVSIGVVGSAKYMGALFVPLYLSFPLIGDVGALRRFYVYFAGAMTVALWVFVGVNLPLLDDPTKFVNSISGQFNHAVTGHTLRIHPIPHWFSFHLLNSLIPGVTVIPIGLALAWIVRVIVKWQTASWEERLLIVYVIGYYLVIESVPMKTEPDFARYVIPIVPVVIIFAWQALHDVWECSESSYLRGPVVALGLASVLVPAYDSVMVNYNMNRDTREVAARWLAAREGRAILEAHAGVRWSVWSVASLDIAEHQRANTAYLVASSFMYDRYYRGSRLSGQDPEVYRLHRRYEELFSYPYVEIVPAYRSYAYSNPVIRIVDIRGNRNNNDHSHRAITE